MNNEQFRTAFERLVAISRACDGARSAAAYRDMATAARFVMFLLREVSGPTTRIAMNRVRWQYSLRGVRVADLRRRLQWPRTPPAEQDTWYMTYGRVHHLLNQQAAARHVLYNSRFMARATQPLVMRIHERIFNPYRAIGVATGRAQLRWFGDIDQSWAMPSEGHALVPSML